MVLGGLAQFVVAVLLIAVLWYLIGILKNIRSMTERLERGSELVSDDLFALRHAIKDQGAELWAGMKALVRLMTQAFGSRVARKKQNPRTSKEKESEAETG